MRCHKTIEEADSLFPNPLRNSFSLVELVIVVVIIGVIAAIEVPIISSSCGRTAQSAPSSDLAATRRAIDMYATEHGHFFPGSHADGLCGSTNSTAAFESQFTKYSAADGSVSALKDAQHPFGPYLRKIPEVSVGKNKPSTAVAIVATNSRRW